MGKRILWISLVLIVLIFWQQLFSMRLQTIEKALETLMPESDSVEKVVKNLSPEEMARVKARLGGDLVLYQEGSRSGRVEEKNSYTFYFSILGGQRNRVALIEEQPGKMGPVEFMIVLDVRTGKVVNMGVMSYEESRGRNIARQNFLRQFIGLKSTAPIQVRNDIRGITGATISSNCTCFAVRKALVLYEEFFLKG